MPQNYWEENSRFTVVKNTIWNYPKVTNVEFLILLPAWIKWVVPMTVPEEHQEEITTEGDFGSRDTARYAVTMKKRQKWKAIYIIS